MALRLSPFYLATSFSLSQILLINPFSSTRERERQEKEREEKREREREIQRKRQTKRQII